MARRLPDRHQRSQAPPRVRLHRRRLLRGAGRDRGGGSGRDLRRQEQRHQPRVLESEQAQQDEEASAGGVFLEPLGGTILQAKR